MSGISTVQASSTVGSALHADRRVRGTALLLQNPTGPGRSRRLADVADQGSVAGLALLESQPGRPFGLDVAGVRGTAR